MRTARQKRGGLDQPDFDLLTDPEGRKWAAIVLAHPKLGGLSSAGVARKLKGVTKCQLSRLESRYRESGGFSPRKRAARTPKVTKSDIAKLKLALKSEDGGPRGQLADRSLRRAHTRLSGTGVTAVCRESYRKELLKTDWACQTVQKVLPLTKDDCSARVTFARLEYRRIAGNTMYTDSSVFPGEIASKSKIPKRWAHKSNRPTQAVPSRSGYHVHFYAGITKFGATNLYLAKGTKGAKSKRPVGRPPKTTVPADAPSVVQKESNAVDSAEYRRILGQDGSTGLLQEGDKLFGKVAWRFQQDGAGAHTVSGTPKGIPTRALIERHASLVEPWPARSADMSPIEKSWAAVEQDCWANERWSDLESFIAAMRRSWVRKITPRYCARLFGGIRQTYACVIAKGGREIRGWGKSVK